MQFPTTFCVSLRCMHFTNHFMKHMIIWWYHSAMKISKSIPKKKSPRGTTQITKAPLVLRLGYDPASHTPKGHRTIPADLSLRGSAIQVAGIIPGCFWWVVCRNKTGWCEPSPPCCSFARHVVGKGSSIGHLLSTKHRPDDKNQISGIRFFPNKLKKQQQAITSTVDL